ncbi:uncharacterized protein LOC141659729 [Apium graveolens]|uniref:uncharacterized protein LOC141659729 n=1 Tax=Apium graveolens TaxID=4045 RepID=UPI003D7A4F89
MLTLLIPGPKEAGNNIDVYLRPFIKDLKLLWDQGERVYDAYHQENFTMRAMIFCTICDFPVYGNLSGYSIKGANACPICEDATIDIRLKNCKKNVYMGHRTFLPLAHPYRKRKRSFDGTIETRVARLPLIGKETKDGVKARLDLQEMGVRTELAPQQSGKRAYLPPACYTLSTKEKIRFCECLSGVKVPSGYSSNPKIFVSMKDLKLVGMKSHDCHVLMQHLLPITIRGILPKHVRVVITKLWYFFNAINSKVIDPMTLDKLQVDIIVTLCEFEMYFLHSFFDIMVHLVMHLVREIKICGPLYLCQMYPFERFLCIFKAYVKNRYLPEASIVEGYSVEETIEFCTDYLASTDSVGIARSRHEGRLQGQGTLGHKMISPSAEMLDRAHLFVLQHMTEVNPYLQEHIVEIQQMHPSKSGKWVTSEHNRSFRKWFKNRVMSQYSENYSIISNTLKWLTYGLDIPVRSYQAFDVNGCKWFDIRRGVRVNESGFTLVNFDRFGHEDDPFIFATQVKQVFYVRDPADHRWSIILQSKRRIVGIDNVEDEKEYNQFHENPPFSIGIPTTLREDNADTNYARNDHDEGKTFLIRNQDTQFYCGFICQERFKVPSALSICVILTGNNFNLILNPSGNLHANIIRSWEGAIISRVPKRKLPFEMDKWRHIIIKGKAQTAQPKAPSTVHQSLEDGDSDKLLLRSDQYWFLALLNIGADKNALILINAKISQQFSDCIQDGPTNNEFAALTITQTEARALVHKSMEDGVTDKPTLKVYMRRHKMHQQSPQTIKVYTRRHKRGNKATAK